MTTRVFDCHPPRFASTLHAPVPVARPRRTSASGFWTTTFVAFVLVPIAGAGERPIGWLLSALAAMSVLLATRALGGRLRWGWLALLAGAAGLILPRPQLSAAGPPLFVATVLALVLWLANRDRGRRRADERPEPGTRGRTAQIVLGLSGERHVGAVLARELPQEFVVINGLTLPRAAGDLDHVVVGPSGVFLLETKTMAGHIMCEPDGSWRRTRLTRSGMQYDAYIGDPATQVRRNIFAVRDCLRVHLPHLFRGTPLWIEGLVVFPHPNTQLETQHSRVPAVLLDQATARICLHSPRRGLAPAEVDAVVATLLREVRVEPRVIRHTAQALVELALALPVVLALAFGTLAMSRLVQAQTAVVAVAHEAARAGALAPSAQDAVDRIRERAALVAPGLGLDPQTVRLEWDLTSFSQDPGRVDVRVRYRLNFGDLPLVGWISSAEVHAQHVEWVDPYRSGMSLPNQPAD